MIQQPGELVLAMQLARFAESGMAEGGMAGSAAPAATLLALTRAGCFAAKMRN